MGDSRVSQFLHCFGDYNNHDIVYSIQSLLAEFHTALNMVGEDSSVENLWRHCRFNVDTNNFHNSEPDTLAKILGIHKRWQFEKLLFGYVSLIKKYHQQIDFISIKSTLVRQNVIHVNHMNQYKRLWGVSLFSHLFNKGFTLFVIT